jgi:lipoprotein NlpD
LLKRLTIINIVCSIIILSACSSRHKPAPISEITSATVLNQQNRSTIKASEYIVKKGETLYSIAWRANSDVRTIAKLNKLAPPYKIFPGQKIFLSAKSSKAKQSTRYTKKLNKSSGKTSTKVHKKALALNKKQAYGKTITTKKTIKNKPWQAKKTFSQKIRKWVWPAKGKLIGKFSNGLQGNKGIDIAGRRGDKVVAAAKGKVVYAGDALRGYGNLIIIKHNDDYLSAYAHNDRILVREQQHVKAGDIIAKMGNTDAQRVMLHFEVRFRGKSVNPLKYLPKK